MRLIPVLAFLLVFLNCYAQHEEIQMEGMVVDSTGHPIPDTYIINLRNYSKAVSKKNGIFEMKVLPNDSLVITHISFDRILIPVFDLMKNPVIKLKGGNQHINQVDVSPNQTTDYERAMNNLSSIKDIKLYDNQKIEIEPEPVMQMMMEHNSYHRSEATSVRIFRFSPSEGIQKIIKKLKKTKTK